MHKITLLDDEFIYGNTIFSELILELKKGFATQSMMFSMRNHHDFPSPEVGIDSTLLLRPTWYSGPDIEDVIDSITFKP